MADRPLTLFDELVTLTRSIRAGFDLRVKKLDLTFARARLLTTIGRNPGASQSELATALEIETPTLKRLLDALEGQGLAERRPLEGDARKHAIFLTDTTRIEPLLRFRDEVEAALVEGIAPEDLAAARRVLGRMTVNAEKLRRE
ncbi:MULTISPECIES: MarR family winged helix-turn-helix transcriptional regulator [Paracoccus]|uniref:MarR family transcriptional regulator n=1 Tax=Paracoccus litorisediminis TaxID=2006130 RepID=A0A844HPR0_9RHOB|nr:MULTISPECIES: MarR family transcriptional regulator [Paracoccus]MBD9527758.1 MarR family transcriptional regulator [Paracoccus sp. PAR01]MTH60394.1 MarR family transcriptional regulator [Paracoccus litorisediminis]